MSQGGSGTNDLGNAFNVTGITIQKAEKIAYRTLTNYLTPNSTYLDLHNATKQAVTDLYGASGTEYTQNINAWYAVGIPAAALSTSETSIKETEVSLYPNPVNNGFFTIRTASGDKGNYEVYDLSGRIVIKNAKLNNSETKVSVNGLQSGTYLVKITVNNKIVSKKLIVK